MPTVSPSAQVEERRRARRGIAPWTSCCIASVRSVKSDHAEFARGGEGFPSELSRPVSIARLAAG